MRTVLLYLLVGTASLCYTPLSAQSIQNGNFESMIDCPPVYDWDTVIDDVMANWYAVQGTPDGFNVLCPAMDPASTPGIPDPEYGNGFASFFAPSEVFGQTLDQALDNGKDYCISFVGRAHSYGSQLEEGHPCLQLCVYGSILEPEINSIGIPIPIAEMEGTALLGCSEPLSISDWQEGSITFVPEETYPYILIAGNQAAQCGQLNPYLVIDELVLEECEETVGIQIVQLPQVRVYPNPAHDYFKLAGFDGPCDLIISDLNGRIILSQKSVQPSTRISLDGIDPGLYILSVRDIRGDLIGMNRLKICH